MKSATAGCTKLLPVKKIFVRKTTKDRRVSEMTRKERKEIQLAKRNARRQAVIRRHELAAQDRNRDLIDIYLVVLQGDGDE